MRMIRICFGLILLLAASGRMLGQAGATGSILGTITDGAGAILPNVQVTVTNTATGSAFQTVTSSAGDYLAPALSPGTYSVSAQAQGFRNQSQPGSRYGGSGGARGPEVEAGRATETEGSMGAGGGAGHDSAALSHCEPQQVKSCRLNGRNFHAVVAGGARAR